MTVFRDGTIQKASSGSYGTGTIRRNKTISTSDATATVIDASPVVALAQAVMIRGGVVGKKSDGSAAIDAQVSGSARRQAGNVTLVGTPLVVAREDSAGTPAVTFVANTTTQQLEIKVAGIAAETWQWESNLEITVI